MIDIPTWVVGIENPTNPYLLFVKQYSAGTKRIKWENKRMNLKTEDPVWVKKACRKIMQLSRYDLCTLYTYTTQSYSVVTGLLRHKGDRASYITGLVHNRDGEWLYGSDELLDKSSYLNKTVDEKLVIAYKNAKTDRKWVLVNSLYSKLKPFFTKDFLKICHKKSVEFNRGMLFYPQAARLYALNSLSEFKRIILVLTNEDWIGILDMFIDDMDAIFDKMPPTEIVMSIFRGVGMKRLKKDASFASTTLSKEIAQSFVEKCCVHHLRIPIGTKMVPLIPITRYFAEQEILLPRRFNV